MGGLPLVHCLGLRVSERARAIIFAGLLFLLLLLLLVVAVVLVVPLVPVAGPTNPHNPNPTPPHPSPFLGRGVRGGSRRTLLMFAQNPPIWGFATRPPIWGSRRTLESGGLNLRVFFGGAPLVHWRAAPQEPGVLGAPFKGIP